MTCISRQKEVHIPVDGLPPGMSRNGLGRVQVSVEARGGGGPKGQCTIPRTDPCYAEKVKMAWRPWRESTMTLKWIAQRSKMGAWTYVSNCLVQKRKQDETCQ